MQKISWLLAGCVLAVPASAASPASDDRAAWNRPFEPFRLYGNVWYVGTAGLSSFLITGPQGHVLIDGGLPESAPLIAANIRRLGFRPQDVKYLLINHAHVDHSGGLAELKRLTGATLIASAGDRADLESGRVAGRPEIDPAPPVKVDRLVGEGGTLRLGSNTLVAHMTPGHTRGCTSWSMRTAGKTILFACSLSVAGQKLAGDPTYPRAAADFRTTFTRLKAMKADIFVNFHAEGFDLAAKRAAQKAGKANAFVDPTELARQVRRAQAAFEKEAAMQRPRA